MVRNRRVTAHLFLVLIYAAMLSGTFCDLEAREARASTYITPQELPPQLLPPPPAEGSDAWKDEMRLVLKAQKAATPADIAAMKDEAKVRLELMTGVIGEDFTEQRFPKTFLLLQHVFDDTENVVTADKIFWHTRRPYLTDRRVKLHIPPLDDSPSFPSGHTCSAHVLAEILGILYPGKISGLRARANQISTHRIEAGVHYPNDVQGGTELATLIVGALVTNAAFSSDLSAAEAEIASHKD